MSGVSQFIATIDFETTGLSRDADVIEVGVAICDRQETIKTWSSLVRRRSDCRWDENSAQVHKITPGELGRAPEPVWAACKLNQLMTSVATAYCDGYQFDRIWMGTLFRNANIEPAFSIAPIEEMPRMRLRVVQLHLREYLSRTMVPHRAGADALRLMQAYCYAVGKAPNVAAVE